MTDTPPTLPEGVHLNDDGSVDVVMGRFQWHLRVPTIAEWRDLKLASERPEEPATKDLLTSPFYADWLALTIKTLCPNTPPPTTDDMSMWAILPTAMAEIVEHWTFVPLARGSRNAALVTATLEAPTS